MSARVSEAGPWWAGFLVGVALMRLGWLDWLWVPLR